MESNVNLYAPWIIYSNRVAALFEGDPQIQIIAPSKDGVKDGHALLSIFVKGNPMKAAALAALLPEEKVFGNITLDIVVDNMEGSKVDPADMLKMFEVALDGNSAFVDTVVGINPQKTQFPFVIMAKAVAQYPNDNAKDYFGMGNEVMADLAKDIFNAEELGIGFTTATGETTAEE